MSFLIGFFLKLQQLALCEEIPEILPLEYGIRESYRLESGIKRNEYRIPLTTAIRNPSSTDKESGIPLRFWETAHLPLV